jgi:hypothetical protein
MIRDKLSLNPKQIVIITLLILITTLFSCKNDSNEVDSDFDLEPFRELARDASCANIVNRLFLIDREMVFWDRRGNCMDASYAHTLYGGTVDTILCYDGDSIAGLQYSCEDPFKEMFDTITANLDESDLGLGENHKVEKISF